MSDSNYKPDGTGVVMGDTKPMPDRGTTTGMTGMNTHSEGMGMGGDETNSMGSIAGATKSDPWDECCVRDDPKVGGAKSGMNSEGMSDYMPAKPDNGMDS